MRSPSPAEFRVLLLRRPRMPLPLAPRRCACQGMRYLGAVEACCLTSTLSHVYATRLDNRVARNARLADMNLDMPVADDMRIEVVGLPLWHLSQLAPPSPGSSDPLRSLPGSRDGLASRQSLCSAHLSPPCLSCPLLATGSGQSYMNSSQGRAGCLTLTG